MLDWPFEWFPDVLNDQEDVEKEAKSQIYILEKDIEELRETIDNKREKYRAYIKKGAQAPETRRKIFAVRARTEKFKAHLNKLKMRKKTIDMMKWTMKLGEAELTELQDEIAEMEGAGVILDWDTDQMQTHIREMEARLQSEMDKIEEMMGGMQIGAVGTSSIDETDMQEEELMEKFAQNKIAEDDIDIEEPETDVEEEVEPLPDGVADLGLEK
jgi:SMC interacting uncharacterized protein involved in chromosome segregation